MNPPCLSAGRIRIALTLALAAAGCGNTTSNGTKPMDQPPSRDAAPDSGDSGDLGDSAVRTAADRDRKNGEMVEVFGTYQHVAGGKAPDAKPDGHAAVRLDDGTQVWLQPPWHADAIRPADELTRYDGKPVVAKGLLFAECPPPPDGRAYAKVPCLTAAILVMDRRAYDALQSGELD